MTTETPPLVDDRLLLLSDKVARRLADGQSVSIHAGGEIEILSAIAESLSSLNLRLAHSTDETSPGTS